MIIRSHMTAWPSLRAVATGLYVLILNVLCVTATAAPLAGRYEGGGHVLELQSSAFDAHGWLHDGQGNRYALEGEIQPQGPLAGLLRDAGGTPLAAFAIVREADRLTLVLFDLAEVGKTDPAVVANIVMRPVDHSPETGGASGMAAAGDRPCAQIAARMPGVRCRDDTPTTRRAAAQLGGARLYRRERELSSGYGGYLGNETSEEIHLCRDGRFLYRQGSRMTGSADNVAVHGDGGMEHMSGRWSVIEGDAGVGLFMRVEGGGEIFAKALRLDSGVVVLDEVRYRAEPSGLCP